MEHWGQEITVTFRVKGLNMPLSQDQMTCQMKIKDVYKSQPEAQGAKGPVFSRLGPPKEGSTKRKRERVVDPLKIEIKEVKEEDNVEEIIEMVEEQIEEEMEAEPAEGAVALWPYQEVNRTQPEINQDETNRANSTGPSAAIPLKWEPIRAPEQDNNDDITSDYIAKGARPKQTKSNAEKALMQHDAV